MELNDLVRGVGPPAVPDLLDQPLGRYRLAACEQQQSEQRAWLGSAERDLSAAVEDLERYRAASQRVFVDREVIGYAVALADATRRPGRYGMHDIAPLIEYGASPRGPIGLIQAAQALALLRGRTHVQQHDVRDLAPDVLRHRLVLSYDALADRVRPDDLIDRLLATVQAAPAVRLAEAA